MRKKKERERISRGKKTSRATLVSRRTSQRHFQSRNKVEELTYTPSFEYPLGARRKTQVVSVFDVFLYLSLSFLFLSSFLLLSSSFSFVSSFIRSILALVSESSQRMCRRLGERTCAPHHTLAASRDAKLRDHDFLAKTNRTSPVLSPSIDRAQSRFAF